MAPRLDLSVACPAGSPRSMRIAVIDPPPAQKPNPIRAHPTGSQIVCSTRPASPFGTGCHRNPVPFDHRTAGPAPSAIGRVPLDHGRPPRSRRRRRLVGAVLGRTPASPLLADQIVHVDRRGARGRRRTALAGRSGGAGIARPRPGRRLGAGKPHHRSPPAVHDGRAPHGQPRRGLAAGARRLGEGLPEPAVRHRRGNAAHLRQLDHLHPGPDGGTGHGSRAPGVPRRAPLQADGRRPRRVGPGEERCRLRIPRTAPHDRGHCRLR